MRAKSLEIKSIGIKLLETRLFKTLLTSWFLLCFHSFIYSVATAETFQYTIQQFHSDQNNCRKCHLNNTADSLILLTGEKITHENTPELCGQCHGVIKRNWDAGTHGKKIKSWTKSGQFLICIECHKPHNPKFPKFIAKPPMQRPKFAIPKGSGHE